VSQSQEIFGGLNLLDVVLREKGMIKGKIGVETGFVSARLLGLMQAQFPNATFEESAGIVEELRMIKSAGEIAIMRIGARMAVAEYQVELQAIHAGVTEYEVALKGRDEATRLAAHYLAEHGRSGEMPLDHPVIEGLQIITSGPRLDMVHALASNRKISAGDIVLLDFCRIPQLDYYRIGFARNAALRELTGEETDIYETVARSYRRALEVLRPGVPAEEPDLVAREILDKAGLGETFVHRTGRGVGLEGVERPEIGAGDKTPLRPGMVVTIEPSVYFQGFAVHVEDTFLITADGYECLTECPREVKILSTAKH
jgi:Xaa-Pro aminopeptidase